MCSGFDVVLSYFIQMFRANTTKRECLLRTLTMGFEIGSGKDPIVGMISFNFESFFPCHCFQPIDTLKHLVCSIQILQEVEYFATCMVNKEATTWISMALFSKCVWETTLNWREIVVCWYTIARHQMILFEYTSLWRRMGSLIIRSWCWGLSVETRCALELWSITCRHATLCREEWTRMKSKRTLVSNRKPKPILHQGLNPINWSMR